MKYLQQVLFGTYQQCNVAPEILRVFSRPKYFLKTFRLKEIAGLETEQIAGPEQVTIPTLLILWSHSGVIDS